MIPEIRNRNRTIPRIPLVNSDKLRRCAGVNSLDFAIDLISVREGFRTGEAAAKAASTKVMQQSERDVCIRQGVMAGDFDLEIGVHVTVDVAVKDREVTIGS